MAKIFEAFNIAVKSKLIEKPSPSLLTSEMVGLEVELEGLTYFNNLGQYSRHPSIQPWWNVVNDDSLRSRNGISGEFVMKEPMFGMDVINALTGLHNLIPEAMESERTSVHVHLDVRNLSFEQLLRLLCCYILVEPILFNLVSPKRKLNPYCMPVSACSDYLKSLCLALTDQSSDSFRRSVGVQHGFKYAALNFLPVSTQGSVEFRHMEGTTDPVRLGNWVNAVLAIKRYAMNSETAMTIEEIRSVIDSYEAFVGEVFEGVDIPALDANIYDSIEEVSIVAKCLLRSPEPFNSRAVFETDASDSPFWRLMDRSVREYYFEAVMPRSRTHRDTFTFDDGEAIRAVDPLSAPTPRPLRGAARGSRNPRHTYIPSSVFNSVFDDGPDFSDDDEDEEDE